MMEMPRRAKVELFAYDEEQTKFMIDKVLFKEGVSLEKTIPTSEQYNDLIPVAKGKMSQQYYEFLKEKYGWKWIKDNVFGGNLGEMNAYETDINNDFEYDIPVTKGTNDNIGKSLENNGLGESVKFSHEGLNNVFLLFAKGIIPKLTAEQFGIMHLELYGRILPIETCEKLVQQINKDKTSILHSTFTAQLGDSIMVQNALSYLSSKAEEEGWSDEKLQKEAQVLRLVAKKLEKATGVTLGRSWVHDDCRESKDSALKKTFNFISKSLDRMITGTVRDVSDADLVSRTKIKLQ